jgi:magnesium chelatase family protein
VRTASHLLDACKQLHEPATLPLALPPDHSCNAADMPDLRDVRGQQHARRALEVAAAGSHSLLLMGPPGTGKTLLASRLPGLLPELSDSEALETAAIKSISPNGFEPLRWKQRPFRAPHHTASAVALAGGGNNPRPGEISLAHRGVLFLDELPEYQRQALEVLREPLETGHITISRAARQTVFPARFQLVAAMNPCPCGYAGDPDGRCHCTTDQVQRYRQRISGPLLDRIDLQLNMPRISWQQLHTQPGEDSQSVRKRVEQARALQANRGTLNAQLSLDEIQAHCRLDTNQQRLLEKAVTRFQLSPRGVHRILKVSRTLADLAGAEQLLDRHLQEAIGYRCLTTFAT